MTSSRDGALPKEVLSTQESKHIVGRETDSLINKLDAPSQSHDEREVPTA